MDSHNRLRGRGCSGVSARPSDAAWTAVSSLCTPTPTCTSRSYVWFRVRSVMVVAPPVGAVPGGREARAARALPGRAAVLSLSAPWQKSKRVETTTHRGRTRSNEPIIEGSRYKKVEARRYKVKPASHNAGEHHPAPDQTGRKRRTPPLGPRPAATERYHDPLSVAELRYEILNTGESRSTRGTLLGRPTAILLGAPCSSRRRGVFGPGTITQTHNHVGVVEWSLFPGISICVLHMWLRVS